VPPDAAEDALVGDHDGVGPERGDRAPRQGLLQRTREQPAPGQGEPADRPAAGGVDDVLDLGDVLTGQGDHRALGDLAGAHQPAHGVRPVEAGPAGSTMTPPLRRRACTAATTATPTATTTTTRISQPHHCTAHLVPRRRARVRDEPVVGNVLLAGAVDHTHEPAGQRRAGNGHP
jgi:hypothetical protein